MSEYQVIARKYRPQTFADILGQSPIVKTLINAIKYKKLAHAYLFCGSRGTGKTTLARVFAKALNCQQPADDYEPCNKCPSCKEITTGNSLDVLEIDGASNRGIDDIRQINETVAYTPSKGKYKLYIIDEVHMLTKEAFNALLKTLEEPPEKVKFFFATTEPHKVLPTILSRCQRYNLNRIPDELIISKLQNIATDLNFSIEEDALRLVANRAEGGLRDAESLFDQIIAFHNNETITASSVAEILGVMPRDTFFELDQAGNKGDLSIAFDISYKIFSEGKDLLHFIDMLTEHLRNLLIVKMSGPDSSLLSLSKSERKKYATSASFYRKDQCLMLLDYLIDMQSKIRFAPSSLLALESTLLYVLRSHSRVPVEILVKRLGDLEERLQTGENTNNSTTSNHTRPAKSPLPKPPEKEKTIPDNTSPISITEDPTPTTKDLGPPKKKESPLTAESDKKVIPQTKTRTPPKNQYQYDTLMQFAAVELEGALQKNIN